MAQAAPQRLHAVALPVPARRPSSFAGRTGSTRGFDARPL